VCDKISCNEPNERFSFKEDTNVKVNRKKFTAVNFTPADPIFFVCHSRNINFSYVCPSSRLLVHEQELPALHAKFLDHCGQLLLLRPFYFTN
jgi:hypothetical protein